MQNFIALYQMISLVICWIALYQMISLVVLGSFVSDDLIGYAVLSSILFEYHISYRIVLKQMVDEQSPP